MVSLPKGIAKLRAIEVAGSSPSSVLSQIDALDLSNLSSEDIQQQQVRTLLCKYESVFLPMRETWAVLTLYHMKFPC